MMHTYVPPPPCRVPDEFVVQSPDAANPPTFFLLLSGTMGHIYRESMVRYYTPHATIMSLTRLTPPARLGVTDLFYRV
jgi:hypothetical protein